MKLNMHKMPIKLDPHRHASVVCWVQQQNISWLQFHGENDKRGKTLPANAIIAFKHAFSITVSDKTYNADERVRG
jgi:hypothetical protein